MSQSPPTHAQFSTQRDLRAKMGPRREGSCTHEELVVDIEI
jgi:hypothetical protein